MPRYISQHTLACLTRQGAEQLAGRLHAGAPVAARRVLVNMQEGKMLVEFDAPGREELEKWLACGKISLRLAVACRIRIRQWWLLTTCLGWRARRSAAEKGPRGKAIAVPGIPVYS